METGGSEYPGPHCRDSVETQTVLLPPVRAQRLAVVVLYVMRLNTQADRSQCAGPSPPLCAHQCGESEGGGECGGGECNPRRRHQVGIAEWHEAVVLLMASSSGIVEIKVVASEDETRGDECDQHPHGTEGGNKCETEGCSCDEGMSLSCNFHQVRVASLIINLC